jgi:gluconokinase
LGTNTSPIEILQSALESVALRFREVYEVMKRSLGAPQEIIASGGALLHSRVWTQMLADALGQPLIPCIEPEATSRGAALLALERIGAIRSIGDAQPQVGEPIPPAAQNAGIYRAAANRQHQLYKKLFEENS